MSLTPEEAAALIAQKPSRGPRPQRDKAAAAARINARSLATSDAKTALSQMYRDDYRALVDAAFTVRLAQIGQER